jgi:hypothetical protein
MRENRQLYNFLLDYSIKDSFRSNQVLIRLIQKFIFKNPFTPLLNLYSKIILFYLISIRYSIEIIYYNNYLKFNNLSLNF